MEAGAGAVASLTMDCEDMFKEITKKLYGEETSVGVVGVEFPAAERELDDDLRPEEHITAWGLAALMQNGFPPPGILQANFTPRTDPTAEDRWTAAEEPLAWAHSRIASYNPAQRLFKCADCECVGFLARVAEHWLGTHSQARAFQCPLAGCGFASGWARGVRSHLARDHHSDPGAADHLLRDNPALDDLTRYLQRLKTKVETMRTERRAASAAGGAGGEAGAAGAPGEPGEAGKRYACGACPYATDRRDLFTRHENIHRDEKPFHCYLCQKQFNRADHVKKHFLRMHRDQPYDINRIRRASAKPAAGASAVPALHYYAKPPAEPPPAPAPAPPAPAVPDYRAAPAVKLERPLLGKSESPSGATMHKPSGAGAAGASAPPVRRKGERRYACCYCAWSGADNWCLKRHLNTHLKPFACALCEYKAARAERLATHVHKVHNKKACAKCPYLADDQQQLAHHLRDAQSVHTIDRCARRGRTRLMCTRAPSPQSHRESQPEGAGGGDAGRGASTGGERCSCGWRRHCGRCSRRASSRGTRRRCRTLVRLPRGVGRVRRRVRTDAAVERVRAGRPRRPSLRARQGECSAPAPRDAPRALPALLARDTHTDRQRHERVCSDARVATDHHTDRTASLRAHSTTRHQTMVIL